MERGSQGKARGRIFRKMGEVGREKWRRVVMRERREKGGGL